MRPIRVCLQTDKIETEYKKFDVSKTAIKDKSLLGTHAQKLCDNIDAYWMTPTCDATTERMCKSPFLHNLIVILLYIVDFCERSGKFAALATPYLHL